MKKTFIFFISLILLCGCNNKVSNEVEEINREEKEIKEPIIEYECRIGDVLVDDICINKITNVAIMQYKCPAGYTTVGGSCWKTGGVLNLSKCGANHVELGGYCYQNLLAQLTYTCASGEPQGSLCIVETKYQPTEKYTCEEGFTLNINKKCEK